MREAAYGVEMLIKEEWEGARQCSKGREIKVRGRAEMHEEQRDRERNITN